MKPDEGIVRDHETARRSMVGERTGYDQCAPVPNRMGAQGAALRNFTVGDATLRVEPLAYPLDQIDRGHRGAADLGAELPKVIKGLFWFGVEDVTAEQRSLSEVFVMRLCCGQHGCRGGSALFHATVHEADGSLTTERRPGTDLCQGSGFLSRLISMES